MRTCTPRSRSSAVSRGRMKVVSDRFISLAMACISVSHRPRASGKTARGLPSRGLAEKTSMVTTEKRRGGLLMHLSPCSSWHMDAGLARIDTTFRRGEEPGVTGFARPSHLVQLTMRERHPTVPLSQLSSPMIWPYYKLTRGNLQNLVRLGLAGKLELQHALHAAAGAGPETSAVHLDCLGRTATEGRHFFACLAILVAVNMRAGLIGSRHGRIVMHDHVSALQNHVVKQRGTAEGNHGRILAGGK